MKMIIENYHDEGGRLEILTENSAEGGKTLYLEGPSVMSNRPNRNGRNYDKQTVAVPCVERYVQEYIQDRRAIGELEHPDYPFPKLSEAATMTESMTWHGDNAVSKIRVLNNPKGQIIKSLAEANFNMAVSTRGLGDVRESKGVNEVLPGFMLTAVDVVDRPSGQVCYMKAMMESVDWVQTEGGAWIAQDVNSNIDNVIKENSDLESDFLRRFESALGKLG
ncbi:prohead core protein serine protease [Vibrio phage 1.244.A._10N.261.54.C3]|nr:prohead core protein serine protease [Vibrio phage 1.244.A._10N.261.54.C3]AUR98638.1 prohead core protein serine protease [Vibrio phage 1.255.O._10N.286.45.F1]